MYKYTFGSEKQITHFGIILKRGFFLAQLKHDIPINLNRSVLHSSVESSSFPSSV